MQSQPMAWHYVPVLAVLASSGLGVLAGADVDKKNAPKTLPPGIVEAWEDAGAKVGWMKKSDIRATTRKRTRKK